LPPVKGHTRSSEKRRGDGSCRHPEGPRSEPDTVPLPRLIASRTRAAMGSRLSR